MSVYVISDLHLSLSVPEKTMTVFRGWDNYIERIYANCSRVLTDNDTLILAGDISWGLKIEETVKDFEFINKLPGKKVLVKGNHDLWWPTVKKINEFFTEHNINNISVLYNNTVIAEDYAVCGSRGWFYDQKDEKILNREAGRLSRSISLAEQSGKKPLLIMHYPPVYGEYVCEPIFNIIKSHGIKDIYHGHIHGAGLNNAVKEYDGIRFHLISADCIDFTPKKISF